MSVPFFDHLQALEEVVRSASQVLLFSDFDGTLVPFKERPENCYLDDSLRGSLVELTTKKNTNLAIISGRDLMDIRTRIGIPGIGYAGNHGLEIEYGNAAFREPVASGLVTDIHGLIPQLERCCALFPGAWVQLKRFTLSVHYRQLDPALVPILFQQLQELTKAPREANSMVLRQGKQVLEIRPNVPWNKGHAVGWLQKQMSTSESSLVVFYLGDDETDEDVFNMWHDCLSIHVGTSAQTKARFTIDDYRQTHEVLRWLLRITNTS